MELHEPNAYKGLMDDVPSPEKKSCTITLGNMEPSECRHLSPFFCGLSLEQLTGSIRDRYSAVRKPRSIWLMGITDGRQ